MGLFFSNIWRPFSLIVLIVCVFFASAKGRNYADHSVLKNGKWLKFGITADGVYKISFKELKSNGVNVKTINPKNFRLFGNGGGVLPENNSIARFDDLIENAIKVTGEEDGVFDSTDFVVFYGKGPHKWVYSSDTHYHHIENSYSDTSFYFLTFDQGPGKRISIRPETAGSPATIITTFDDYAFHETDKYNLIKSGRAWYGEQFDLHTTQAFALTFPNITSENAYFKSKVASRSIGSESSFQISINGSGLFSQSPGTVSDQYLDSYARDNISEATWTPTSSSVSVSYGFNKGTPSAIGWLDFFELNVHRSLIMSGSQMGFRASSAKGIVQYQLGNAQAGLELWDVTDIANYVSQAYQGSGTITFITAKDTVSSSLKDPVQQFEAFYLDNLPEATYVHEVKNQDLHSITSAEMIIVSHPSFLGEAERLRNFHVQHDGIANIVIVTPDQIFNEFSSGAQDISAIRDFVKMVYDRHLNDSINRPHYLLLIGDGSYDYKNHLTANTNFIPTYQSPESLVPTGSYTSDDFYGFYDDTEGEWDVQTNNLDIAIGRLPVKSAEEAQTVVNKILSYNQLWGDWRNEVCFVSDDTDELGTGFVEESDALARAIQINQKNYNVDKIYIDAFKQESSPGGDRYPEATLALNNRVEKGALIVNYVGHGGESGWTHERVLGIEDIQSWTNIKRLPLFLTATCDFSRFDDPGHTSAGELTLLSPTGGAIALLTTVRVVYADANAELNREFYKHVFPVNGVTKSIGEIYRLTKVAQSSAAIPFPNARNFILLGDPAIKLNYPPLSVKTTEVNSKTVVTEAAFSDTSKGLSKVTIKGFVKDINDNKVTSFNGLAYPTVYNKQDSLTTLNNDRTPGASPFPFSIQKNILYKGKVLVKNGDFTFSFIVPKDVGFRFGNSKISYYVTDNQTDGSGYFEKLVVGGISANAPLDVVGPDVKLFMNNSRFVFGGLTDQNPLLYATLADSNGINTVGSGIGHDLTAVLDNDKTYQINDYYEADTNSYQTGKIMYPFKKLKEGRHSLKLKAWDVYNNSSETSTEFVVASSAKFALDHILNYPNPFTTHTSFFFEHNKPGVMLNVMVRVYTISGKLVKTIIQPAFSDGFRVGPIDWDGRDDFGDKIGRGVYIYNLRVKSSDGALVEKYEKLVILN